jgi:ketosteroid isomerase-like protein
MTDATTTQTFEDAIRATNRAFETAFDQADAASAAAVYSNDGQAFPPNGGTISGREALQNFWQGVMGAGIKSVTLETVELEQCGERAFEVGRAILRGEGGSVADTVKFIVVWKNEDGQWKWHRDIWSSINPA